jgi:hypothetical protein
MKEQSQMIPKRKRVNSEEDLQKELDKLRIELGNSKSHKKILARPILEGREDEGLPEPIIERKKINKLLN